MLLGILLITLGMVGLYIVKPAVWGKIDGTHGVRMYQSFRGIRLGVYEWAYRFFGGR